MAKPRPKLTPSQRAMVDDGCPLRCIATPENQRRSEEAWRKSPPRAVPFAEIKTTRNEDEATAAFRAQVEAERVAKSRAQIVRMKQRFATKAIDFSKVRWDARRNKFVPLTGDRPNPGNTILTKAETPALVRKVAARAQELADADQPRVTKDNAEAVARLNGVWKPEYEKLRGTGRIVMTVGNVLKGLVKRGGTVKWQ
jgi:hypothetical protein